VAGQDPLDMLKAVATLTALSDKIKTGLVSAVQTTGPENLPRLSPIKQR
jgi:hypothetical protein